MNIPPSVRRQVWERDYGDYLWANCKTCGNWINALMFDCSHDKAKSKGGSNDISNLHALCQPRDGDQDHDTVHED